MKKILFQIIVVLLTPFYLIIKIFNVMCEFAKELGSPVVDGIIYLIEEMTAFWKKIFKIKKEQQSMEIERLKKCDKSEIEKWNTKDLQNKFLELQDIALQSEEIMIEQQKQIQLHRKMIHLMAIHIKQPRFIFKGGRGHKYIIDYFKEEAQKETEKIKNDNDSNM